MHRQGCNHWLPGFQAGLVDVSLLLNYTGIKKEGGYESGTNISRLRAAKKLSQRDLADTLLTATVRAFRAPKN